MKPLLIYLFIINALGVLLMLTDKFRAKNNLWRIPEAVLMSIALIGGSLGCIAGMFVARHKTRHIKFRLGLPLILGIQMILLIIIYGNTVG